MTDGSSNPPPPTALATSEPGKKKWFPLDRVVLLAVLLVVAVLVVIDYRARFAYQAALEEVANQVPNFDDVVDLNPIDFDAAPTQQQVQAIVGKPPDEGSHRSIDVGLVVETYSWRGIFRTFAFQVRYRKFRDELRLESIASVRDDDTNEQRIHPQFLREDDQP